MGRLGAPARPEAEQMAPFNKPLLDSFGRRHTYLRVSITDRCNLRCVYCMPAEGIQHKDRAEILRFHEVARLARIFAGMGVRKIRLTGGEPLVRRNVEALVGDLARIEAVETLGLTTNGLLLAPLAPALRAGGLSRLNVSLDTLRAERFERITRRRGLPEVLSGIEAALGAGFPRLKLNIVVMGGVNDDELLDFVELARARPIDVRFIEYMPLGGNQWRRARLVPFGEMKRAIERRHALEPLDREENPSGGGEWGVAREFRIAGFRGTVGFIPCVTEPFCGRCNRLRLTANGCLKTCLFEQPEGGLRDAMRAGCSDEELEARVRAAVLGKPREREAFEAHPARQMCSMVEIGG